MRRFRAATLKGWAYALDHADEIAGRLPRSSPTPGITDPAGFAHYQADVATASPAIPKCRSAIRAPNAGAASRKPGRRRSPGTHRRTPTLFSTTPSRGAAAERSGATGALIGGAVLSLVAVTVALSRQRRRSPVPATARTRHWRQRSAPPPPAEIAAGIGTESRPPCEVPAPPEPLPPGRPRQRPNLGPGPTDLNAMLTALEPALRKRYRPRIAFRMSLLSALWRCETDGETCRRWSPTRRRRGRRAQAGRNADRRHPQRRASTRLRSPTSPASELGEFARITVRDGGRRAV